MKQGIKARLNKFALDVQAARREFEAGPRDASSWVIFYDMKQDAYDKLCGKHPQIKEIQEFWRWVQNSTGLDWIDWTETEIIKITKRTCPCGAKVKWPAKTCPKCQEINKNKAKQARKSRKAVNRRVKALSRSKDRPKSRRNKKHVD